MYENKTPTKEDFENSKILIQSQIELLPEEIVTLRIFAIESIKLLANFN